jgi:2-isopropylmalate synthase
MSSGSRVEIFDTTLRDGGQREGISWSVADKLRIAARLDELGVDVIEGGWPGSNPKDAAFFAQARRTSFRHARLAAFGATRRAGIAADDDGNLAALLEAETPVCAIFGKSSPFQVAEVLRTTLDENLAMIEDSVRRLAAAGRRVIYDAEHFFDGWREDPAYALSTLRAAAAGGATTLVLCDTNGGSLPWQIEEAVAAALTVGVTLGIHAHDDAGCGVANSLAAVRAGVRHVQGTLNGYGERCGNANLCAIVPGLALKLGHDVLRPGALAELTALARWAAELANLVPDDHAPYVGRSAFAHKGGVHVAAVRRAHNAYEHVDPTAVGNQTRVVVSDLAGRGSLAAKAEEDGFALDHAVGAEALSRLKDEEAAGFAFDAADGSVWVRLRRLSPGYRAPFALVDYRVVAGRRGADQYAEATLKLDVGGEIVHTAAEGDGPVHALDAALRKALVPTHPQVGRISLDDYKVRILDGRDGTRATTRVLIDFSDGDRRWSTVGASPSILEATWLALADGLERGLSHHQPRKDCHESDDRALSG